MSTMLKFKYYGHHVMSRKFKYRYIESMFILPKMNVSFEYHSVFGIVKTGGMLQIPKNLELQKCL